MNSIQIADETYVAADAARVSAAVADRCSWRRWWPDLRLQVTEDRADKGIRWTVTGALTGTMEIWLEPSMDGVLLHYFLHAEPTGVAAWQLARMNLARMTHHRRVAGKKMAFEVKTVLERSRPIGVSPVTLPGQGWHEGVPFLPGRSGAPADDRGRPACGEREVARWRTRRHRRFTSTRIQAR